jgi:hypothetical protein
MTKSISNLYLTLKSSDTCSHKKRQILEGIIKSLFEHNHVENLKYTLLQKSEIQFLKNNLNDLELWSKDTKFSPKIFMQLGTICDIIITEHILLEYNDFKEYSNYFRHQIIPKDKLTPEVRSNISEITNFNINYYFNNAWKTNNWELNKINIWNIIKYIYLIQNYQFTLILLELC